MPLPPPVKPNLRYLKLKAKSLQRDFYVEMCRIERWSVRTLRDRIGSMLYERTALSRRTDVALPQAAIRQPGQHQFGASEPPCTLIDVDAHCATGTAGKQMVSSLSRQLTQEYGGGF